MKWLKSIWAIIASIGIGVAAGLYFPNVALHLEPLGKLYLSFLKMCVIPVMMTAIVSSVGRLFISAGSRRLLVKILTIFAINMFIVGVLGMTAGLLGRPGTGMSAGSRSVLGTIVIDHETAATATAPAGQTTGGLLDFIFYLVPDNIFLALNQGNNLQILFFSLVIGAALGMRPSAGSRQILDVVEYTFKLFQQVIAWSMNILPFGLVCIMAAQTARTGPGLLQAMLKYIGWIYLISLIIIIASGWLIAAKTKMPYFTALRELKDVLTIAFGTQSSVATMPTLLDAMRSRFKLNADAVNLVIPLGIMLCRYSMVLIYTLGVLFIAQLYQVRLGVPELLIVLIGSVVAAVAGAGTPGIISLSLIPLFAGPLGLPWSAGLILLMAANPLIDPIVTAANIHLNSAAAVLIIDREEGEAAWSTADVG